MAFRCLPRAHSQRGFHHIPSSAPTHTTQGQSRGHHRNSQPDVWHFCSQLVWILDHCRTPPRTLVPSGPQPAAGSYRLTVTSTPVLIVASATMSPDTAGLSPSPVPDSPRSSTQGPREGNEDLMPTALPAGSPWYEPCWDTYPCRVYHALGCPGRARGEHDEQWVAEGQLLELQLGGVLAGSARQKVLQEHAAGKRAKQ